MAETRKITDMAKMKKSNGHDITEYKEKQEDLSEPEEPRENEGEKVDKRLPIDKGWAWMIVVGQSTNIILFPARNIEFYTVLFINIQLYFYH